MTAALGQLRFTIASLIAGFAPGTALQMLHDAALDACEEYGRYDLESLTPAQRDVVARDRDNALAEIGDAADAPMNTWNAAHPDEPQVWLPMILGDGGIGFDAPRCMFYRSDLMTNPASRTAWYEEAGVDEAHLGRVDPEAVEHAREYAPIEEAQETASVGAGGAMSGMMLGALLGPVGMVPGAVIGGVLAVAETDQGQRIIAATPGGEAVVNAMRAVGSAVTAIPEAIVQALPDLPGLPFSSGIQPQTHVVLSTVAAALGGIVGLGVAAMLGATAPWRIGVASAGAIAVGGGAWSGLSGYVREAA